MAGSPRCNRMLSSSLAQFKLVSLRKIIFAFFGGVGVFYICMKLLDFFENWLKSEYKGKKDADNIE